MLWWTLPSLAGTAISLWLVRLASQQMRPPAAYYCSVMCAMIAWWCTAQWVSMLWIDQDYRYFMAKLQYVAITSVPLLWFFTAMSYSGFQSFLVRWYPLFWILPCVTVLLAFTNDYHGQLWRVFEIEPGSIRLQIEYGPWFMVHAVYSYSAVMIGTVMLAYKMSLSGQNRLSLVAVLAGPAIVLSLNIPFIFGINALPIDPTPTGFAMASVVLWLALRHNMFAVLPIARRFTLDKLSDGVVVIDDQGLIADRNPASRMILGAPQTSIGARFSESLPAGTRLQSDQPNELQLADGRWLDVRISKVQNLDGPARGQVALLRDITRDKLMQETVLKTQRELESVNARLQALARTDDLTRLANRRHLYERLREEWSRAHRRTLPLSIMLIDFDNFKQINDTHGHQAGDLVLVNAAQAIRMNIRPEDLAARHGGEEFAVLLPDTDLNEALDAARRIHNALEKMVYETGDGQRLKAPVSIGVANMIAGDATPDALVARADGALYHSKHTGRNAVSVATDTGFERLSATGGAQLPVP